MTTQSEQRGDVAALVPAAGAGLRLGPGAPKALRHLAGEPLLVHAVRRLLATPDVGCVVVAAPPGEVDTVQAMLPEGVLVVEGGATRQSSVANALRAVPAEYTIILVHDAARALTPPAVIARVAAAVRAGALAVIPVLPVVDTIKRVDDAGDVLATVDRAVLRAVQTPQGFDRKTLTTAHDQAGDDLTDDAGLVEMMGVRVATVPGDDLAMKITRPLDLKIAEALL
ncbi:2-C-methyl-D-erythritol 4-phosphate cytidylyltransferase [Longispora fulva]|uniref:2-C-methyl-D-erythritol 4-phosphate cytidylyltransferase n=1 Tax=Longispora fulva TaxID=619741 RepID=A0A8J7GLV6_9ACTN|nr:2-C-methyl-D-erythritol 4-phosphate cytidylyltransferase [Longispora fulva]MBG6139193.1 2-C-methyl-D-erythritol 4-phosphate cytidylyltransferase [Longispora fulva]